MLNADPDDTEGIPLNRVLDEWVLLEFDFQALLGIRLERERNTLSWRAFTVYLAGLFGSEDSLIRRHFRPDPDPATPNTTHLEDA